MAGIAVDSATSAPRKRAMLVCFRCHGKKIKCDLVGTSVNQPCSNCAQAETPCRLRPSRRGLGRRRSQLHRRVDLEHEEAAAQAGTAPGDASSIAVETGNPQGQRGLSPPHDDANAFQSPLGNPVAVEPPRPLACMSTEYPPLPAPSYHPLTPSPAPSHAYSTPSSGTKVLSVQATSFGDAGYMTIFSRDNVVDEDEVQQAQLSGVEPIPPALQESFVETYLEYCSTWCPVLDRNILGGPGGTYDSPLLQNALALCGTQVKPPLIQYKDPRVYYNQAKELFYNNYEGRALIRLASIMLFYWWSTGAPNQLNMDNAWWWTGIAIRVAQECGLNREPQPGQLVQPWETAGLRRRIWWTLFARDRVLSLSQGRPTIIDPGFCDVSMVGPADFPDAYDPRSAQVFIHWVRLLEIGGRMSKHLGRDADTGANTASFSRELTFWVQSLPSSISLSSIRTAGTRHFDRDAHRLHITYLAHVTLLHLTRSSHLLPRASTAAIVAASCTARLFGDILARGSIRFLTGDAGWEIAVALLALLHARRMRGDLRAYADADIQTLLAALREMASLWPSSRMFACTFDRLARTEDPGQASERGEQEGSTNNRGNAVLADADGADIGDGGTGWTDDDESTGWIDAFPFVTEETSPLISAVLARNPAMPCPDLSWPLDINASLQEFLEGGEFSLDMLEL